MIMCNPFMPVSCTGVFGAKSSVSEKIGGSVTDMFLGGLAGSMNDAIKWVITVMASWILVPSTDLCAGDPNAAGWLADCNAAGGPAQQLRGFLLPITVLVMVGGLIWQGITMVITRKGEPMLQAVRGVWTSALWGAIGIGGTHLALKASDSYSLWILNKAIINGSNRPPLDALSAALGSMLLPTAGVTPLVTIFIGGLVFFLSAVQAVLMIFREGSVVILAGTLQLAATGSIMRGTSQWLSKVTGWGIALIAFKPVAMTVYATGYILTGGNGRSFLMGLTVLVLSVVALPTMMKFFSWTTGAIASGGGSAGMAAAGAAAGLHAASSLRSAGGSSAGEHARYLDTSLGGTSSGRPTGAVPVTPTAMPRAGASSSAGAAPVSGAAGRTAAAGRAAGGGATAASGVDAAATGPTALVVTGVATVAEAAGSAAKSATNAAASTTQDNR
ncbi:hypothetical protein RM555_24410 [Micromonospora sp. DSM 115977]|uniref:TrbL/VirB6 plasmid conjugal transfer protein n=1 Tax=Micromonospora reichwaldensis TaxID=3075516 RepID=A0ABU2X2Z6_9ACTN|nr:hypothetical protein [Micromonospora sp. DSM 115977]MDT0532145.1 hypothetical protein [Micromonospora sp. DSM 115977]